MIGELIGDKARSFGLATLKNAAGLITRVVPIPQPVLLVGAGSSGRLGQAIADCGHRRVLIVTDAGIDELGLTSNLTQALRTSGVRFSTFTGITQDSPISDIEAGIEYSRQKSFEAIIAFGGGSVIDAAKVIGLAVANQKTPLELVGYFKGWRAPLPLYAVPTTAGTGSEVTVAAVISDPEHGRKRVVADTRLVPEMAALDPALMVGLPAHITASTGIDALTHAVEAYLSRWANPFTDRMALAAVSMIFRNLPKAFAEPENLQARQAMSLASAYAGLAFTRANVGNVHAIAHQLGARYHTPHGLANSLMLPHVLQFMLPAITPRLAQLSSRVGVANKARSDPVRASRFIASILELTKSLQLPDRLADLRDQDVRALARAACAEADDNYPVPMRMSLEDCEQLLRQIEPSAAAHRHKTQSGPGRNSLI